MTPPPRKAWRLLAALGMLSVAPATLFIEAEIAARMARAGLSSQADELATVIGDVRLRPLSCAEPTPAGSLSFRSIDRSIANALHWTFGVNDAFHSYTLFWSFQKGLPWTSGLYSVYEASGKTQDVLARLTDDLDLCRRVPEGGDAGFRREEQRSQAWLDAQRARLEELYAHLKAAKAAYERDRLKLTAAAWSLGLLQVVGWGSLFLVVLPHDIRSWRARRAEMKKGGGAA
jgi:hypothetical protein